MKPYAIILTYNRLDAPRRMADWLADSGTVEPIILDNASDYPPLLEYLARTPHKVFRNSQNGGNCAAWYSGVLDAFDVRDPYIVSDGDLGLDGIPGDYLDVLQAGLDKYPWACKAGFGLRIDDLPNTPLKSWVLSWEVTKWAHPLEAPYYRADIDTTFALYRRRYQDFAAVRTGQPYVARHLPWYYTPENIPEDEAYYLRTAGSWASWATKWRATYGH